MLKGHVFEGQIFENQIFALFIDTFLSSVNGVSTNYKNGMQLSYSGNQITIQSGAICIQGRFLEEDVSTTITTDNTSAFNKLVIEIDLDKQNTEDDFQQAIYKVVRSSSAYPTLTQNNIVKNNSGVYQYELARFKTGTNGITEFQDMRTFLDFTSIYSTISDEKDSFFENLEDTSSQAVQDLIDELTDMLDELSGSQISSSLITVNNPNYASTDLSNALSEIANKKKVYNKTLSTTWIGNSAPFTQNISISGIASTDIIKVYPVYSTTLSTRLQEKEEYNKISVVNSGTNQVEFICDESKPTRSLDVRIEVEK